MKTQEFFQNYQHIKTEKISLRCSDCGMEDKCKIRLGAEGEKCLKSLSNGFEEFSEPDECCRHCIMNKKCLNIKLGVKICPMFVVQTYDEEMKFKKGDVIIDEGEGENHLIKEVYKIKREYITKSDILLKDENVKKWKHNFNKEKLNKLRKVL